MKLNKTFGRIATTLVATAMLASVAAVPAFAETGVTGTGKEKIDEITIKKVLYLPTGTTVPGLSYDFNIVADQNATGTFNGKNDAGTTVSLNVKPGEGGGSKVNEGTVVFSSADSTTELKNNDQPTGVSYVTKEVTLSLDSLEGFDDAGVYKYDITETRTGDVADGVTATNGTLDLYVYVNRVGSDYVITGAVVTEDGQPTAKTDTIKNYYDVTPGEDGGDPTANKGSLSIAKTVTGAMGDYSEDFEFTIQGIADGTYNIAYTGNVDATRKTTVTVTDGKATLPVQHNEKVTIYGIAPAEDVTVSENAITLANEGYTVTATSVNGEALETPSATVTVDVVASETATTAFTNNREAVSPTGLIMDIAPYVLLVVVAAAGCFVFLRKRRED